MTKTYFIAYIAIQDEKIVKRGEMSTLANITNEKDLEVTLTRIKDIIKNKHNVDDVAITAFNEV